MKLSIFVVVLLAVFMLSVRCSKTPRAQPPANAVPSSLVYDGDFPHHRRSNPGARAWCKQSGIKSPHCTAILAE